MAVAGGGSDSMARLLWSQLGYTLGSEQVCGLTCALWPRLAWDWGLLGQLQTGRLHGLIVERRGNGVCPPNSSFLCSEDQERPSGTWRHPASPRLRLQDGAGKGCQHWKDRECLSWETPPAERPRSHHPSPTLCLKQC